MPQLSPSDISKLCDDWCSASVLPGGGMAIGANTEKFRLLANGVVFHELCYESLCAAVIGLTKVLLRPGLNTFVVQDHFGLWSWCGELLLNPRAEHFNMEQHEIKSLYEAALHASLAGCRKPASNREEWLAQNRIQDLQPHHAKRLLQESSLVLAYLTFPLLEAVLKRACSTYVSFDGQVKLPFAVQSKQGNQRMYDPQGRFRGRQCSSLRDLLHLHYSTVAAPGIRIHIDRFRDHIAMLDNTQDPFDVVYSWRNQSLHGSTNFQTIGGTLLNLNLLLSLSEIENDFEQRRVKALENCQWEARSSHRSPWSFYPPY